MTPESLEGLRLAQAEDRSHLVRVWAGLFDDSQETSWIGNADEWFAESVDSATTRFPLIEFDGEIVSTAIGTLEIGVPNPFCPSGRSVRLANVITLPEHRGKGHGTTLTRHVVEWARSIGADRVDLSATDDGRHIYEKLGFIVTSAPRMKLVL